jgi:hypothetical protein
MNRNFLLATFVAALLAIPAASFAQFQKGDWDLTLSGNASNGPDFDGTTISAIGTAGYFVTDQFELTLQQTVGFSDIGGDSALNASTGVGAFYNFNVGDKFVPYAGAYVGYAYGDAIEDTFFAGPAAGVRFFVNNSTYINLGAQYQFYFNEGDDSSEAFSDGQFIYSLGVGFILR